MLFSILHFIHNKIRLFICFLAFFSSFGTVIFAQPTDSAPTPPSRSDIDVISIFSDAYSDVTGTNFNPFWDQNTVVTTEDIDGNSTLKYASFNYQGTELDGSQNVSTMEFVHVDLWTSSASEVNLSLISPGPAETPFSLSITPNTWKSYDIPLSEFSDIVDLTNVFQFKFDDGGAGDSPTLYIDNLYFYKSVTDSTADASLIDFSIDDATVQDFNPNQLEYNYELPSGTTVVPTVTATPNNPGASIIINPAPSLPGTTTVEVTSESGTESKTYSVGFELITVPLNTSPNPPARDASDVISVFSDSYSNLTETNFNPFWGQATKVSTENIDENNILRYEDFNYQGIEFSAAQDVSGMDYVHIDLWTSNATAVSVYLISPGPAETLYSLSIVPNVWKGYDIPLSEFSDEVDLTNVFQFKFDDSSVGDSPTIYLDNIYFFKGEVGSSTDATLADLKINDVTVPGFAPSVFTYEIEVGADISAVPEVTATLSDENAELEITPATELPGSTLVEVTAADQATTLLYTIEFIVVPSQSDASLSDLQIEGGSIEAFSPLVFHYVFDVDDEESDLPIVSTTTSSESATVEIIPASTIPGTTVIKVTSEDETRNRIYSVFFKTEDLIWWDEFTNPDLDLSSWSYDVGDGCAEEVCGWGNQELQAYQKENVYIDEIPDENGNYAMVFEAGKNPNDNSQFVSGRVNSQGKVDIKYGILEIRMRVPDLKTGLWPAAWLLGTNNPEIGWPRSGEIDVMEMGQKSSFRTSQGHPGVTENQYVGSNVIWYSDSACNDGNPTCAAAIAGDTGFNNPYVSDTDMNDRFQIYRLYWDETAIRFTVEDEDVEYDLYSAPFGFGSNAELQSTFRKPYYMVLNMAVGGNFTDAINPEEITAPFPAKMYIDYIRLKDYNGSGEVFLDNVITSSETNESNQVPAGFSLSQNYPNPFNPSTEIAFELQSSSNVRITVFDVLGRQTSILVNDRRSAGLHTTRFNATNLSSGIYFYTLEVNGSIIDTKKMILLK